MKKTKTETPPRTIAAFNVGITGHRALPDSNLELLKDRIACVLREIDRNVGQNMRGIEQLHKAEPYVLRLISMLAEGSDQISANCALKLGYQLQCALPMNRAEYEKDFMSAEAKEEFYRLLQQAESVLEIEACTKIRSRAYQDCGHVMLAHSDLLMAIWDGKDSGKVGGTSDIIEYARQLDIPVIWINAGSNHEIRFLYGENTQKDWPKELEEAIKNVVTPWYKNRREQSMPQAYMKENCKKIPTFEPEAGDQPVNEIYGQHYLKHFRCADGLAQYYRRIYRSCGVLRQFLPFIASLGLALGFYAVLFGGPNGASPDVTSVLNVVGNIGFLIQPVCFFLIIVLSKLEKKFRWHQKFTDYRALGELLRHMAYLAPAGLVVRGLRAPAFNLNVNLSWVNWQFRAVVREAGIPSCTVDDARVRGIFSYLNEEVVKDQIRYHKTKQQKVSAKSKKLEKFGMTVYYIGITVVALRFGVRLLTTGPLLAELGSGQKSYISTFFNMLSMVIPLFSALAFGIASQEGFTRIGQLSSGMGESLLNLSNRLAEIEEYDFNTLKKLTQNSADLMLSEFSDWNIFVKSKLITDH